MGEHNINRAAAVPESVPVPKEGAARCAAAGRAIRMLGFDYTMELDFGSSEREEPGIFGQAGPYSQDVLSQANNHAFTLRCLPQELPSQHVLDFRILMEPETELSYQTDSFGNRFCYGMIRENHSLFRVQVSGHAERFPDRMDASTMQQEMIFRSFSKETRPGPVLTALYRRLLHELYGRPMPEEGKESAGEQPLRRASSEETLSYAAAARDLVHSYMTYKPDATRYDTRAEQAAKGREGVCQDFSHMLLALCRMAGVPARYTAGLLIGEGRSHAWVEVAAGGLWHPMDPTNPDIAWDQQVIFSHGRDAEDCKINRGTYYGPSAQMQFIRAAVYQEQ